MGIVESVQSQVQRITNEATISVLNKISNSVSVSNQQSNVLDLSGSSGNWFSGINQKNTSSVNIQLIQQSAADGSLQASMENQIKTALSQASDALGYAKNKSSVDSVVHNSIKANVTAETVTNILISSIQSNAIKTSDTTKFNVVKNITQSNLSESVTKLTSGIVADVTASLVTKNQSQATGSQKVTNPLSEGIRNLSDVIKSAIKSGTMLWIIVIIAILLGGGSIIYMFRGTISKIAENKFK